ncbi:hypothetical protein AMTRI_Chr04g246830 [Amborella trichopoda]
MRTKFYQLTRGKEWQEREPRLMFMGTPYPAVNVIGKLDGEGVVLKKATQGKVDFDVSSLPVLTVLDRVVDEDQKINFCNSVLKDADQLNLVGLVRKGDQDSLLHFIVLSCRTMATRFLPFRKAAHENVGNVVPHTPLEE